VSISPERREILSLKGVSISFRGNRVISNVSLVLHRGESLAIIGLNGSGKTSLLRSIAGILEEVSGEIRVDGRIGMVFQDPDLSLFGTTVEENLLFSLDNCEDNGEIISSKIETSLERFSIAELRKRDILSLSGGERQRVALAAATIVSSDLLLLDEPFSMLNRRDIKNMLGILNLLKERGTSIVLSTNRFSDLSNFDSFLVLGDGSTVFFGSRELLRKNREVFKLAGMPVPFGLEFSC
jgi:energy-coupling factor transporter ATP-binding protein EcfA2